MTDKNQIYAQCPDYMNIKPHLKTCGRWLLKQYFITNFGKYYICYIV